MNGDKIVNVSLASRQEFASRMAAGDFVVKADNRGSTCKWRV